MEELYKDINRWIREQRHIQHDEETKKLADILVEGFMQQLSEKPTEEVIDKKQEEYPQS